MSQTNKQKIGAVGEEITSRLLEKKGFKVIERNYRKKWGEIDIIAQKDSKVHFFEVKTVRDSLLLGLKRPEDNVHYRKLQRLSRALRTFLLEKHVSSETSWQLDIALVFLDQESRKARIRFINNVIIDV